MIRPLDSQSEGSDSFDPSPYISDLFSCTIKRLKAADIDQEVKERAISCMGQIICNLGDRRLSVTSRVRGVSCDEAPRPTRRASSLSPQATVCRRSFLEPC